MVRRLVRARLPVDTVQLARYLIGKTLVHDTPEGRLSGRIVEAEAYPIGDAACHAFRGRTVRNQSLFLRPGHAYVFFNYGVYWMMNVSSEEAGCGGGVLIRGLEPLEGSRLMQRNRGVAHLEGLTKGPGRLAMAMQIDKSLDGVDLCSLRQRTLAGDSRLAGGRDRDCDADRFIQGGAPETAILREGQSFCEWPAQAALVTPWNPVFIDSEPKPHWRDARSGL